MPPNSCASMPKTVSLLLDDFSRNASPQKGVSGLHLRPSNTHTSRPSSPACPSAVNLFLPQHTRPCTILPASWACGRRCSWRKRNICPNRYAHVCVCVCVNARMHVSMLVCICLSTHVCDRAAMVRVSLGVGRLGQGQPQ